MAKSEGGIKGFAQQNGGKVAEMYPLPPALIKIDPAFNPRVPGPALDAHIRDIANKIHARGYDRTEIIKIKLIDGHPWVRDGHCRLAAVALAASEGTITETVPCVPMPRGSDEIDDAYMVLSTQQKLLLSPEEWTIQIKKLLAAGQEEGQIAKRLGKPKSFVTNYLDIAESTPEVREAVHSGGVSLTLAGQVVRANGRDAGEVIARAREHARARGKSRATSRDVEAVTKPREAPVSLCTLAMAAVAAWRDSPETLNFQLAMEALERHLGPLAKAA